MVGFGSSWPWKPGWMESDQENRKQGPNTVSMDNSFKFCFKKKQRAIVVIGRDIEIMGTLVCFVQGETVPHVPAEGLMVMLSLGPLGFVWGNKVSMLERISDHLNSRVRLNGSISALGFRCSYNALLVFRSFL